MAPGSAAIFGRCTSSCWPPVRVVLLGRRSCVCALRSLLRWLHLSGAVPVPLAAAVPSVAGWRLSGLPKGLEPSQLRSLVAACDRRTSTGRRDYAIMLLRARLGLRAGELARLGLDDVDWRRGEILVLGKGNRAERLPLPAEVGAAIAGYLRRGRPASAQVRSVFVRVHAPHQGLTSGGVTMVVFESPGPGRPASSAARAPQRVGRR
jgi:integrase